MDYQVRPKKEKTLKYTIFGLSDARRRYVTPINKYMSGAMGWERVPTEMVDGARRESLESNIYKHGYDINWRAGEPPRVGQLGIWYTVLNSFELAPHVTFEDDALIGTNFKLNWNLRMRELPESTDFFSLFIPRDSDHMFDESMSNGRYTTKVYQRYGGVSMYYTKQGTEKIKELLKRDGITDQYDNTLYAYAKAGELNGYCSKPTASDLVYISGLEESIVQESKFYESV